MVQMIIQIKKLMTSQTTIVALVNHSRLKIEPKLSTYLVWRVAFLYYFVLVKRRIMLTMEDEFGCAMYGDTFLIVTRRKPFAIVCYTAFSFLFLLHYNDVGLVRATHYLVIMLLDQSIHVNNNTNINTNIVPY